MRGNHNHKNESEILLIMTHFHHSHKQTFSGSRRKDAFSHVSKNVIVFVSIPIFAFILFPPSAHRAADLRGHADPHAAAAGGGAAAVCDRVQDCRQRRARAKVRGGHQTHQARRGLFRVALSVNGNRRLAGAALGRRGRDAITTSGMNTQTHWRHACLDRHRRQALIFVLTIPLKTR